MKKTSLFLALSLAANAAFAAVFFLRPASITPRSADSAPSSSAKTASPAIGNLSSAQLAAFQSGDAAQLKAAGVPDDVARLLIAGRAFANLQAHLRDLRKPPAADGKYWRNNSSFNFNSQTKEQRAEMAKAQRDFTESIRTAFGDDAAFSGYNDTRYSFLPAAKREQIRRIEQDYGEMQSDIYSEINGIQLPSDREKLKLLKQEKERDIAATMSPAEYEQYNLHSSQTAMNIRSRFGDAIQTEDDYKKIYALQKTYDDQYSPQEIMMSGPLSQEAALARRAAEVKLQDDIKAAIGPDNFAAFQKANDQDYKALTSVAKRLNLPAGTADTVFASRDTYAVASQRINADASLTQQDRRTQLTALATQARTDLTQTLGAEGAEAYAARANWMSMLKGGTAFSTTPSEGQAVRTGLIGSSVYPVPPPRPAQRAAAPKN